MLLPGAAAGKCPAGRSLSAWPASGSTIPTNARLLLFDSGRSLVDKGRPPPVLVGAGDFVQLEVVERRRSSAYGVDELVLAPLKALQMETDYELRRCTDASTPCTADRSQSVSPRLRWRTSRGPITERPRWMAAPRMIGSHARTPGCASPGIQAFFRVPLAPGDLRVRVEMTHGRRTMRATIEPSHGIASVGHEGCGRMMPIVPGDRYTVRLWAVDAAGQETPAPRALHFVEGSESNGWEWDPALPAGIRDCLNVRLATVCLASDERAQIEADISRPSIHVAYGQCAARR
jgi:hypothetical protein